MAAGAPSLGTAEKLVALASRSPSAGSWSSSVAACSRLRNQVEIAPLLSPTTSVFPPNRRVMAVSSAPSLTRASCSISWGISIVRISYRVPRPSARIRKTWSPSSDTRTNRRVSAGSSLSLVFNVVPVASVISSSVSRLRRCEIVSIRTEPSAVRAATSGPLASCVASTSIRRASPTAWSSPISVTGRSRPKWPSAW